MMPLGELGPVAAGGAAIASSVWYARMRLRASALHIKLLMARERELRFAAHSLMAASRTSPQAVVEAIDRAARIIAPEIDSTIFALPDDEALTIHHAQGMHAMYLIGSRIDPRGDSPLAVAMRRGHRVTTGETTIGALPGERGFVAIPLVDVGRIIGVICFSSREHARISDIGALVTVVDLAVTAYQLAVERRADIEQATVDGLTGLLTPRAFRRRLFDDIAEARMMRLPASLLFIDTDHFKACNDTYGHAAGDIVLSVIAQTLREHSGIDAVVGRNGGDEFCVLLRGGKASAIKRAEAIRRAVESYQFEQHLGVVPDHRITLSIGVSSFPDDTTDAAALLERADAAMYHSKRSGRNLVSFACEGDRLLNLAEASARTT